MTAAVLELPPVVDEPSTRLSRLALLVENVEFILATDPADVEVVAARVGRSPGGLVRALYEAGRHDLVRRMKALDVTAPDRFICGSSSCRHCGPGARRESRHPGRRRAVTS